MDKMIMCIDPGKTGAIACMDQSGRVWVDDMPDTIGDLWSHFEYHKNNIDGDPVAYLENVGGYMPGNAGPAAVNFSRHVGHIEMALYAAGIPTTKVSPQTWMKSIGVPKFTGTKAKQKTLRKRWIRDFVQRKYPSLKVTINHADALGILCYALKVK
jgi:hypothetical protein